MESGGVGLNCSGIGSHTLLGQLLRWPLAMIPGGTVVPVLQGPLRGKRWIVGSSTHGCWLGSYEYEKRLVFARHVAPGHVVFDVGAHVGYYTLLSSLLAGDRGRVHAFEPLSRNLNFLREHLSLNRVRNATVHAVAVAGASGTASFAPGTTSQMGALSASGGFPVPTVTIDDVAARVGVPDVIKMDIEGAERQALGGAAEVLKSGPTIFLATHGPHVHRECCALLREHGYTLTALDTAQVEDATELLAMRDSR